VAFETVNALDRAAFVDRFGAVFEHSPWVAEAAWAARPFTDLDALHGALVAAMRAAPRERRLALIRAHPDLAGRAAVAGELTAASQREQAGAGLDQLTPDEHATLTAANARYAERFGFPFVICVRGHTKATILAALAERAERAPEAEFETALDEIAAIARVRLEALVPDRP
jgi:2-oxo-4-hydroxy-4-carboxy-5-ureidoimidazoline decarboxylase